MATTVSQGSVVDRILRIMVRVNDMPEGEARAALRGVIYALMESQPEDAVLALRERGLWAD